MNKIIAIFLFLFITNSILAEKLEKKLKSKCGSVCRGVR
jgi:hypothetical protein